MQSRFLIPQLIDGKCDIRKKREFCNCARPELGEEKAKEHKLPRLSGIVHHMCLCVLCVPWRRIFGFPKMRNEGQQCCLPPQKASMTIQIQCNAWDCPGAYSTAPHSTNL